MAVTVGFGPQFHAILKRRTVAEGGETPSVDHDE